MLTFLHNINNIPNIERKFICVLSIIRVNSSASWQWRWCWRWPSARRIWCFLTPNTRNRESDFTRNPQRNRTTTCTTLSSLPMPSSSSRLSNFQETGVEFPALSVGQLFLPTSWHMRSPLHWLATFQASRWLWSYWSSSTRFWPPTTSSRFTFCMLCIARTTTRNMLTRS